MKKWISQKFLWGMKERGKQEPHIEGTARIDFGSAIGAFFSAMPAWVLGLHHMREGWRNTLAKTDL